jgi:hypothetical protein
MTPNSDQPLILKNTGWNRPGWLFVLAPASVLAGVVGVWLLLFVSIKISELLQG